MCPDLPRTSTVLSPAAPQGTMRSAFVRSRIAGTGRYLPRRTVSNDELGVLVDEHPDQILKRTGIGSRHFAADDEAASDLALWAASRVLQASGRGARDVDCIIFATHTP